ncbi:MAG TPA: tetratricopeptide repeat protein [Bryobacteraceae bacterium]|jgi:tetratricopeptide (TPR) repeat protein|nr:tetratricopeptide repeat protein [Bryobacteraceae bacterium]
MFRFRLAQRAAVAVAFAVLVSLLIAASQQTDMLWHHRNLGKAFYENPTTQKQAVEQFRQALDMAPNSVRERVNYGLALLKDGDTKAAIEELEKAQKQDPSIPHTWFNLGIVAKRDGDYARAISELTEFVKLVPGEATGHYNLGSLYKVTGKREEATQQFQIAEKLDPNLAAAHFQLYTAYRQAGKTADATRELTVFEQIKKRQEGAPIPENVEANNYTEIYDPTEPGFVPDPRVTLRERSLVPSVVGIAVAGDDLLAWTNQGISVYRNGTELIRNSGLEQVKDVVAIAAGDYDNDGLLDLCVVTKTGAALYHNEKTGYKKAAIALPDGVYTAALWVDYDHDYDLDLMLLGKKSVLMRNQGDAGFTDQSASFPFVPGTPSAAALFATGSQTAARDIVVAYQDREGVVYEDKLGGKFEAHPLTVLVAGATALSVADYNRDSYLDVAAAYPSGVVFLENQAGNLTKMTPPADTSGMASFAMKRFVQTKLPELREARGVDWNTAGITNGAGLDFFANETTPQRNWMRIELKGIKNLKLAESAVIEVKAGSLYQKAIYHGAPLVFPMGQYKQADTVRITWPNGLIQNEAQKPANTDLVIPEAERLSGSCPMIFTWNGENYQFITDVLGVAPLGASASDGSYFPVDHDEYVQIPGSALREHNGNYEVRVTEELHEVSYIDKIQLIAVDHPRQEEIFTNDKFKSPPFPEFRLFGVEKRIYPTQAHDDRGHDIRPALLRRDCVYPKGFDRTYTGIASLHSIDLDFGHAAPNNRAVLILNGWVDWADGSTFLGASQEKSGGLVFPYLQVQDARGQWKTVIQDMGMPAGKPKTIAVDLTGKFLSVSRKVRIVTNLCVYWDEIFLSENTAPAEVKLTPVDAESAGLHFRGFSTPVIDPKREQPEKFEYANWMPISQWNPTPGLYTRYGDVRTLVTKVDDRLLIMGSGDEVRLLYPASALPALRGGWTRDFLLLVDGWAKDADANTAYSQSVLPLPFHGMSAYPYPANEHFPDDPVHREYLKTYITRPALRLIRPLNEGLTASVSH